LFNILEEFLQPLGDFALNGEGLVDELRPVFVRRLLGDLRFATAGGS
jgi:hypothetical protein